MKNKVRVGGEVSRRSHKPEELGASPRPAINCNHQGTHNDWPNAVYPQRIYPAGFTVQEADRAKMRPFWKELGVIV